MSVVIENPSPFQVQEELQDFASEVGGDVTVDETATGSDRVTVDTGAGTATLVRDGDDGHLKLESNGDVDTFEVSEIDWLEFVSSTQRVVVDMIDFGL